MIPDSDSATLLADFQAEVLDKFGSSVIATVPKGMCHVRIPGDSRSTICTPEETKDQ